MSRGNGSQGCGQLIHAYFGVDYESVWAVAVNRLPEIKPMIAALLQYLHDTGQDT
jgi:uncharacterized protein with HEPN domain